MGSSGRSRRGLEDVWEALRRSVPLVLVHHEIKLGFKSLLLRGWIAFILFFGCLFILVDGTDPNETTQLFSIGALTVLFGFIGSIVHVIISSATITGEVGGIADSLLSKAVQRWEYLISKFASQALLALVVYFLMMGLAVLFTWKFEWYPDDLDWYNLGVLVGMIGLVLVFFTSVGVMFSSMASRTVFALLLGILVWFLLNFLFLIFPTWDLMYSPKVILDNAGAIVDGTWDVDWARLVAFYVLAPVAFFTTSMVFFYNRDL